MTVRWTAPGDDGNVGQASHYDLRYAEGATFDWDEAIAVPDSLMPSPSLAGLVDSVVLSGMFNSNSSYCFALKVADEVPNWSVMSNVVCVETPDVVPPSGATITVQMIVK